MPKTATPDIVSPDDQRVSFVELFFDLVFVYCVTQVVQLLHYGYTGGALLRATLVFWMVWWCWTQFTWTLNAADTTHHHVELGTLLATGVAFFMAIAIPDAFTTKAITFALAYASARLIGLAMQTWVARASGPALHATARRFMLASLTGIIAVVAGAALGATWQYWLWGSAIALDFAAAALAGDRNWNLHAEHFGERHGLFVIITLGEILIVTAAGMAGKAWTFDLLAVATLGVACTGGLWWVYFVRAKPALDHAFEQTSGAAQAALARDAYSLMHFPIVYGLITFAVTIAAAIGHPEDALAPSFRAALAIGMVSYLAGMVICLRRARVAWPLTRVLIAVVLALVLVLLPAASPAVVFALLLLGLATVALVERSA